VWFLLSAFRTQAGANIASRKGTAHATSTLSTLALALSAAFSRSTASFFFHFVLLLFYAVHFLATPPASTATVRHGKAIAFQVATEPRPNDLVQIAYRKRAIWVPSAATCPCIGLKIAPETIGSIMLFGTPVPAG